MERPSGCGRRAPRITHGRRSQVRPRGTNKARTVEWMPLSDGTAFGDAFAARGHASLPLEPLTDTDVQSFIKRGFLQLRPSSVSPRTHASIAAAAAYAASPGSAAPHDWSGNGCFPAIPALGDVLTDPRVHGAFTALLGRGYALHVHRHCHISQPGPGQTLHQDSYEDDQPCRHHRPRWCMAMYYPHDVPDTLGPTVVVPESHWYCDPLPGPPDGDHGGGGSERPHHCLQTDEWRCVVPAGTLIIVHYEIWHRATAISAPPPAMEGPNRFMFKFLLTRMEEPSWEPSWDCRSSVWRGADAKCLSVWDWMLGGRAHRGGAQQPLAPPLPAAAAAAATDVEELVTIMAAHPDEHRRLGAVRRPLRPLWRPC
jgi:hypothetical protein